MLPLSLGEMLSVRHFIHILISHLRKYYTALREDILLVFSDEYTKQKVTPTLKYSRVKHLMKSPFGINSYSFFKYSLKTLENFFASADHSIEDYHVPAKRERIPCDKVKCMYTLDNTVMHSDSQPLAICSIVCMIIM